MKIITFAKLTSMVFTASVLAFAPLAVFADDTTPATIDTSSSTPTTTDTTTAALPAPENSTPPASSDPTTTPAPTATTDTSTAAPTTTTTTSQVQNVAGPTQPTGADGTTYIYNAATGKWENDYYIWDPVTKQTMPKTPQTYSYNPTTEHWDTTEWVYDAAAGKYVENTKSVSQPPQEALISPVVTPNGTPPQSAPTSNGAFDLFFNGSISNTLNSAATSGNALITGNTTAGNALTGNALAVATIINLMQSSANLLGNNLTTFSSDIQGNVVGDLLVDPGKLAQLQANNATTPSNLAVNTDMNGQINNDITVAATSGDATINSNTTAGNAQTGNADALVNLVNFINSTVSAGKSFLGMINIYGNFDGDILLPPDVLNSLLASNTALATSPQQDTQLTVNNTNDQAISNVVTTTAQSGSAILSDNTKAGNAITGNGSTNITLLNLTGSQTVGKNALLVFVNVLGNWVGLIMNAPAGTTAAELGGGITSNSQLPADTTISNTTNSQINNNVQVAAKSGDATGTNNTKVGNAQTGNASASANILNIIGSQLSFSDWFGVLFINVFGSWHGSFGVNTAAGNAPVYPTTPVSETASATATVAPAQVFAFRPKAQANTPRTYSTTTTDNTQTQQQGVVAGTSNTTPPSATPKLASTASHRNFNFVLPAIGILIAITLLAAERIIIARQQLTA